MSTEKPKREYNTLKSIWTSTKLPIVPDVPLNYFTIIEQSDPLFIMPTFAKLEAASEKPRIILISAVGATGKTMLSHALSNETNSVFLDLAKSETVGGNFLTGLLTRTFKSKLTEVFAGLQNGNLGIIIDGVDEARSRVTSDSFEDFLTDIANLAGSTCNQAPSFILLGRGNIIDDCYLFFAEKNIDVTLFQILPFSEKQAKEYIDKHVTGVSGELELYIEARDTILEKLTNVFSVSTEVHDEFTKFLGYAPVLDAVTSLLTREKNYYKLSSQLKEYNYIDSEIVTKILQHLLRREKEEKVIPNILSQLLVEMSEGKKQRIEKAVFLDDEQCIRLLAYVLDSKISLKILEDESLNREYERRLLDSWLQEHPFLENRKFRNVVFESYVISEAITSSNEQARRLALQYVGKMKPAYYPLIFMRSDKITEIDQEFLPFLLASALEFETRDTFVDITIDKSHSAISLNIDIRDINDNSTNICLDILDVNHKLHLGERLKNIAIDLPEIDIECGGKDELQLTPPVDIQAKSISILSPKFSLCLLSKDDAIHFAVEEFKHSVIYPVKNSDVVTINTEKIPSFPFADCHSPQTLETQAAASKIFRLKRILMQFRSHSRGSMARFKDKIEHKRVLKNEWGEHLFEKLLLDGILSLKDKFYHLNLDKLSDLIGVNWIDLRKGKTHDKLIKYIGGI